MLTLPYASCSCVLTQPSAFKSRVLHCENRISQFHKINRFVPFDYIPLLSVLSKWEFFIKMRAAFLLSPSFITIGRMGASKAALILLKNSHFDRTLQYTLTHSEIRILNSFALQDKNSVVYFLTFELFCC